MKTITDISQTVTAAEIFTAYCEHLVDSGSAKDVAHIKTALLRFTVPGWSNRYPKSRKSTDAEVAKSLDYLKRISAALLQDAGSVQASVFEHMQIAKQRQRQPRCILNRMLEWAVSQGYFGSIAPEVTEPEPELVIRAPTRLCSPKGEARQNANTVSVGGKLAQETYALGKTPGDYINEPLQYQITALADFLSSAGLRPPTIKKTMEGAVKRFLGWLHRHRGVALDDLRLESMVPFNPLKPLRADYKYKDGPNKGKIDRIAFAAAKKAIQENEDDADEADEEAMLIIEAYLKWTNNHPATNVLVLDALVNVAKFLYRDQTNKKLTGKYQDVPIIMRLRNARAAKAALATQTPQTVSHACKSIPWSDVHPVVLKVQALADLRVRPCDRKPRSEKAIALNIQRLLILLLFVSYPPDRSRTVYELEVDRTLVRGEHRDGEFVPAARMQPGDQATWFLHLEQADSKTGDTYGETWDKLDDTPIGYLADGKTLYYYLELWLEKYRDVLKPTHKCLLSGKDGAPLDAMKLSQIVKGMFFKHTKVPVRPKELRTMYVTNLFDSKAPEEVLEGSAARMRHSRATQKKIYNKQLRGNKVAPALAYHQQMMQKASQPQKP